MTSSYTSHVGLIFNKQGAFSVSATEPSQLLPILEPHISCVLEVFTHHHALADAHQAYENACQMRASCLMTITNLMADMVTGEAALMLVKEKVFLCASNSLVQGYMLVADPHSSPEIDAKNIWNSRVDHDES